jgi:hypothetical protein
MHQHRLRRRFGAMKAKWTNSVARSLRYKRHVAQFVTHDK